MSLPVKVVQHKEQGVTLGVTDKDLRLVPELASVTYEDVHGAMHTVHYHKDGPFGSVDDVLQAQLAGYLHPFESHDAALDHADLVGDTRLPAAIKQHTDAQTNDDDDKVRG